MSKSALRTIARIALRAHEKDDPAGGYDEITLILVGDAAMRELNTAHRGLERTTDVLSFDLRAARVAGEPRAGEVVISTDRVLAQARRYRVTRARELARLAVHGLLHLTGWDHRDAPERRRMRAVELRILAVAAAAVGSLVRSR